MPQVFAIIATTTDILQIGVAKEYKMKKYDECNMICPSKRMLPLHGTAKLVTLAVNPNTITTGTDRRVALMETIQQMKFSLLKKIPGTSKLTTYFLMNQDSFRGLMA